MSLLHSLLKVLGVTLMLAIGNAAQTSLEHPGLGKSLTIGILLYEGWEPLDVMGPYEILMNLSYFHNITLVLISDSLGPVTTQPTVPAGSPLEAHNHMMPLSVSATHTYRTAPKLDILLVPGGVGLDIREAANDTTLEHFVKSRYGELKYLLSVCTGARVLAKSGVLNGKRATTNKSAWSFVVSQGTNVSWVPSARWTQDGKVWTSSGVTAGMDMLYAFTNFLYGNETVDQVMNIIEYAPHTDPSWDPFSVVYKIPGANMSMSLKDCAGPVGTF
ncbi:class I glutamine amidotransferase-like protein [Tricladium varicosporioides]|nr:class I glutamine amidotransferase-like protein [Hymenoscyphus varicosporioides]